jgi:hypothetical protein
MSARKLQELRKRLLHGQEVGDALLARLHTQVMALQPDDVSGESISNTYVKLAGVQMKWCELELALLRESARQDEQKQKVKSSSGAEDTALQIEPLSEDEWQALQSWVRDGAAHIAA